MDDFTSHAFFDYTSTTSSTVSSMLEMNGTGLESGVKQETFDSSVWIQGFSDIGGVTPLSNHHGFQPTKNNFVENLISESQVSNTPSSIMDPLDPLEMILNQPSSVIGATTLQTTMSHNPTVCVKSQPHPDLELLNALNAASSQNYSQTLAPAQEKLQDTKSTEHLENGQVDGKNESNSNLAEDDTSSEVVEPQKEIDPVKDLKLTITNVVASFRVRCHLNLRRIAQEGINVIYQKESKKIIMRVRRPSCTAYIWSSGKVICTGANSEINARKASRKFAKRLQNIGFQVIFSNYKVINVLAVCKMPYHINIVDFSQYYKSKYLSYEPEIHPAVTYRMPEFKVTFKIFSTGSITLTCPVVARIPEAVKKVYPMVADFFRLEKPNIFASMPNDLSNCEDNENADDNEEITES